MAIPADVPDPPPVAVFPVEDAVPIVRAQPAGRSLLVAGDGEGVVDAAGRRGARRPAPLVLRRRPRDEPRAAERLLDRRRPRRHRHQPERGRRWSTLWENKGDTEQAGEEPLEDDITDNRLPRLPRGRGRLVHDRRAARVRQVPRHQLRQPGHVHTPENRPANALDGDLETAWRVGDFSPVGGERLASISRSRSPPTTSTWSSRWWATAAAT